MQNEGILLQIRNLKTYYYLHEGIVKSVDGVTMDIGRHRTVGVVGESGCGKSVTARSVLRILDRGGRITEGEILFHRRHSGDDSIAEEVVDIAKLDPQGEQIRSIRGGEIAMIFQEPMTSFSPVHTIGHQIAEVITLHQGLDKAGARELAIATLHSVGLPRAEERVDAYPHQLSGGMRQRAMIAMALSCRPSLLIADEPTTAIDVTTQAQILDLMQDLQQQYDMSIMLITHDLGVVAEMADDVAVMYLGKVVEQAPVDDIFHAPQHPYTRALLRSIPRLGPKLGDRLQTIKGSIPPPYNRPKGCLFHPRCPSCKPGLCDRQEPQLVSLNNERKVSCLLYGGE